MDLAALRSGLAGSRLSVKICRTGGSQCFDGGLAPFLFVRIVALYKHGECHAKKILFLRTYGACAIPLPQRRLETPTHLPCWSKARRCGMLPRLRQPAVHSYAQVSRAAAWKRQGLPCFQQHYDRRKAWRIPVMEALSWGFCRTERADSDRLLAVRAGCSEYPKGGLRFCCCLACLLNGQCVL